MPIDIRDHPDAPDVTELRELVVEPVPRETIEARLANGDRLVEDDVREREDLDVYAELDGDPDEPGSGDVGTALYRLVQLFGTPQVPDYLAGSDLSERTDTTFKYLFRVTNDGARERLPSEWLLTVYDWHVDLGVSVASWQSDADESVEFEADRTVALTSLALAHNMTVEPVECEYENMWF